EAGQRRRRRRSPRGAVPERRRQRAELNVARRLRLLRQYVPQVEPKVGAKLNLVLAFHLRGVVFQNVICEEAGAAISRLKIISSADAESTDYREPGDVQRVRCAQRIVVVYRGVARKDIGIFPRSADQ